MRRFLTLVCLLCLALPAGITLTGCTRNPGANTCNGLGYGAGIDDVYSITLQPQTAGISLSFGQTQQVSTPTAYTCKGASASVSSYTYGTTNNSLVDISPAGYICAGTWNRNSGGGIADYTICSKPTSTPSTNGLPYGIAYITASANSVTSNAVEVYVHQQVTSVTLDTNIQDKCYSQNTTASLDAEACYTDSSGNKYEFCAPSGTTSYACTVASGATIPTCASSLGTFTYSVSDSAVASINSTSNVITALLPGTTVITASVAGSASSAGDFSTCPPKSIALTTASGKTTASITQGATQSLTTTITDTTGATITGLSLDYQSTNPADISVSSGSVSTTYPGAASVYAVCQPSTCNPTPDTEIGLYGTGLSLASNAVNITVPGTASEYVWFGAPGQSQDFVSIDMTTGNAGSTVRLPYVPNSMLMDQDGSSLYFGSYYELMIYSTSTNGITKQDANVPGVVLSVSPSSSYALINDQTKGYLYLYNVSAASYQSQSGYAVASAWTPDSKTMYAVDYATAGTNHGDKLYVYNVATGWSTYDLTDIGGAKNLAITVPGLGAFLAGTSGTSAHSWCPSGTVASTMQLYPEAYINNTVENDVLAATNDGNHILGAYYSSSDIVLSDFGFTLPVQTASSISVPTACTYSSTTLTGNSWSSAVTTPAQTTLSSSGLGVTPTAVNQVVASPNSAIAFATYSASSSSTGATLPYYIPSSTKGSLGTLGYVTLTGSSSISAPIAGAFSPDNNYFFVSTAGDNLVHYITIPSTISSTSLPTDSKQLTPALPACSTSSDGCSYTGTSTVVPASVIVVKPRATE
ncbi:hypothetical protein ACOBR2_02955 [Telmatobacter bradus]|uniref:hypothetical protein n=1 Tax=Telmatobacter bradus TaxID=474953 RepID=UPI003B436938